MREIKDALVGGVDVSEQLATLHRLGEDGLHVEDLSALLLSKRKRLDAFTLAAASRSCHHDLKTEHCVHPNI